MKSKSELYRDHKGRKPFTPPNPGSAKQQEERRKREKTIADKWNSYLHFALPPVEDMHSEQHEMLKMSFYAGVGSMINLIDAHTIGPKVSQEKAKKLYDSWAMEWIHYMKTQRHVEFPDGVYGNVLWQDE